MKSTSDLTYNSRGVVYTTPERILSDEKVKRELDEIAKYDYVNRHKK